LDGGEGDKDTVIPPEMPTGGLVGQAVLGDQAYGEILDTLGVEALGSGEIREVHGKAPAAGGAAVSGEGNDQINGSSGARIAQIVQGAGVHSVTPRRMATAWATTRTQVA